MPWQHRLGGKTTPDQPVDDLSQEGVLGLAVDPEVGCCQPDANTSPVLNGVAINIVIIEIADANRLSVL